MPLRREYRRDGRLRKSGGRDRQDGRGGGEHGLQVHVFRSRADLDQGRYPAERARWGGGSRLQSPHARGDFPQGLRRSVPEPVPVRDRQHPRAVLLGA